MWMLIVIAIGYAEQGNARLTAYAESKTVCHSRMLSTHKRFEGKYPFVSSKCVYIGGEAEND